MVTGIGGELYKDFWWLQDFPFYSRKTPNLERLYSVRIAPLEPKHDYLAAPYRELSHGYRNWLLKQLARYIGPSNAHTYDQIYYHFKMRDYGGRFVTNHLRHLYCVAPYLDREAVAFGYSLPRSMRFFNSFHRQTMTRMLTEAAQIGTTEGGVSVSSRSGDMAADLCKYVLNKFSRITRKLAQRALQKTYFLESPNNPELPAHLRAVVASRRSIERLKDYGVLRQDLRIDDVANSYFGNILSLDLLLEAVESMASVQATSPVLRA